VFEPDSRLGSYFFLTDYFEFADLKLILISAFPSTPAHCACLASSINI